MTDIEKKALALVNEVFKERGICRFERLSREEHPWLEALCRAIEQHEAFRQEVSDLAQGFKEGNPHFHAALLDRFIIAKPDPLAECLLELDLSYVDAEDFRAALAKRGGKIVWGDEQ